MSGRTLGLDGIRSCAWIRGAIHGLRENWVKRYAGIRDRAAHLPIRALHQGRGVWAVILTLTDDKGNQLEQETFQINSRDTYPIILKSVTACSTLSNPASCQDPNVLIGMTSHVNLFMPASTVEAIVTPLKLSKDLSVFTKPNDWVTAMVRRIQQFYTDDVLNNDRINDTRTDFIGVYAGTITDIGLSKYAQNAVMVPSFDTAFGTDVTLDVVAHEVGHTLGLVHTMNANPAPAVPGAAPGCWGPGDLVPGSTPNWLYADNTIQSSAGPEYGFNVATGTVINPATTFDIMSYCTPVWISPLNHKAAFPALLNNHPSIPSPSMLGEHGNAIHEMMAEPMTARLAG